MITYRLRREYDDMDDAYYMHFTAWECDTDEEEDAIADMKQALEQDIESYKLHTSRYADGEMVEINMWELGEECIQAVIEDILREKHGSFTRETIEEEHFCYMYTIGEPA